MKEIYAQWILYFVIYAFIGYIVEVASCSIKNKKMVDRGYLFGPVIPIYGFGSIMIILSTIGVKVAFPLVFLLSMLVCSLLEYATSFILEKIYHVRWWDYSESHKFNLNGRICLQNSLLFGLAGLFIVYFVHGGAVEPLVNLLDSVALTVLAWIALVLLLLDFGVSTYAVLASRKSFNIAQAVGDRTNEIKAFATTYVTHTTQIVGDRMNEIKKACRQAIKQLFVKK